MKLMLGFITPRRRMRLFQNCTTTRLIVALVLLVTLYNEFLAYFFTSFTWSRLRASPGMKEDHLKVLFVADPQIQGYNNEPPMLGYVTRWDADRYLHRSFLYAYNFVKPDVIVYMGDLLDEGSEAKERDYQIYVTRFKKIFQTDHDVQHVYLSGDNDVGGEAFDLKEPWKIDRFHKYFTPGEGLTATSKFVDFIRLSLDYGQRFNDEMKRNLEKAATNSKATVRILINHMSLLEHYKKDFMPIVGASNAHVIFTAHTHIARLYTCLDCRINDQELMNYRWKGGIRDMLDNTIYKFNLKDEVTLNEVVVPTCSYRMGVPRMGFGSAIIERKGIMQYTVLWLPSRYRQLYAYIILFVVVIIFLMSRVMYKLMLTIRNK